MALPRNFDRQNFSSHALILIQEQRHRVLIQNFSRMGVGFVIAEITSIEKFVTLIYQNEKEQIIEMKSYVRHARRQDGLYFIGVQFIGIESRRDRVV